MIHHVYANRSNAGDWLSARGIQKLLGRSDVVEHLCDEPFVPATLQALAAAGPRDVVVIGGGGLLMDYFMPFWSGFRAMAERVPFCIWGVGVCDSKQTASLPSPALLREMVALSRLCVVRDELTRDFLGRERVPEPVGCPAAAAVETASSPGGAVMLHVDHFSNVGPENFERMEAMAADFARRTGRRHRKTNNIIPRNNAVALQAVLDLYADADVVLTSRLHGCIISAAMGRPFLAVSGDRKVDSFMESAGLRAQLCGLHDIESLPARLGQLDRDRPLATAWAERARRGNEAVAEQVRAIIAEVEAG